MSKSWIMLTGLLLLGSAGPSQSHPLDSPDIVYIDGLPCNRACQSYMNWSWRKHPPAAATAVPAEAARAESEVEDEPTVILVHEKPAPRAAHSAARRAPSVQRGAGKPATPRVAKRPAAVPATTIAKAEPEPVAAQNSTPTSTEAAASPPADLPVAAAGTKSAPEPAATVTLPAEQLAAANVAPPADAVKAEAAKSEAAKSETAKPEASAGETVKSRESEPIVAIKSTETADKSADIADTRVALVMARPEIETISDLAGKDIAIEGEQSAASASIRSAIASAGAADVRLDEKVARAIDRVVGGEVPAAVLNLVSPEAAQSFPDIPGYRIFRIPLAPG